MNETSFPYQDTSLESGDVLLKYVLPLRQVVLFPGTEVTLDIGRDISKMAVKKTGVANSLLLVTQKALETELPNKEDLYPVGVLAHIANVIPQSKHAPMRVVVRVLERISMIEMWHEDSVLKASYETLSTTDTVPDQSLKTEALLRRLDEQVQAFANRSGRMNQEQMQGFKQRNHLTEQMDYMAHLLFKDPEERYAFLEELSFIKRFELIMRLLSNELEIIDLEADINQKLSVAMEKSQRDFYLREKIKVINEELGEAENKESDLIEFRERIESMNASDYVKERLSREVDRLAHISTMSPDYGNLVNYLSFALALPWDNLSEENNDITHASQILDEDHYGLEKVKERILEFLAVRALHGESRGSIICLVGPPGVGKTSLAKSIARATNRDYVRVSLGGIQDEAEIRGHRRTYIGAMAGRILKELENCQTRNPTFLLDEIDKVHNSFRGDPASALLEALDPAQNDSFNDHYLDLPFDLSKVLFLTTANTIDTIPGPLRDRMEIIEVPSYTEVEKLQIAKRYLLPRQRQEQGLKAAQLSISEAALMEIIRQYTAEAGVRELERQIASVCRKVAKQVVSGEVEDKVRISVRNLSAYLGKPKRHHLMTDEDDMVGIAVGMAWTAVGGEILQIECQTMPGKGELRITGQLGSVMQESAQLSMSIIRSMSETLHLSKDFFKEMDIHIHVPEGAVPKDGPSAGVTITSALASALSGRKLRRDVAMTGEITLRGRVLQVGGIREKVLAAHRAGCTAVVLPKDNEVDLQDIPEAVRSALNIYFASTIQDVWKYVFAEGGFHEN